MKPLFTDIKQEAKKSAELEQYLIEKGSFCSSSSDDERNRQLALETLATIATKWVEGRWNEGTINDGGDEEESCTVHPTTITFGSYSLRAHGKDSDIDVLCLFDKDTSREMFFSGFVDFLRQDSRISDLLAIENACTPVVKFLLNGIYVDLLFASVSDNSRLISFHDSRKQESILLDVRNEYKIDDSDLVGMDEAGVRSLNGVRVTQFIKERVKTVPGFRVCLCAIKDWAKNHGIYGNAMGFLGGINFAILLTHICIEFPESESWPSSVLLKMFPKPVMLTLDVKLYPPPNVTRMPVWDQGSRDIMPIITPAYPSMNSSYNISVPQYRRIQDELIRTAMKVEQELVDWNEVLRGCDFFRRNSNFVQVTISAEDDEQHYKWLSFCRFKMRLLITSLETRQTSIWPYAHFFEEKSSSPRRSHFFLGLRFTPPLHSDKVNLKQTVLDFLHKVNAFKGRTEGMDLRISHTSQQGLPAFILKEYVRDSEVDSGSLLSRR